MNRARLCLENRIECGPQKKPGARSGDPSIARRRIGQFSIVFSLLVIGLFLGSPDAANAVTKTSTGTGNWNTAGTWTPSGAPGSGDDVVIATGHVISYDTTGVTVLSLTLNGTGTLNFNNNANDALTITGSMTNGGTVAAVSASGTRVHTLNVGGDFSNNGTFTSVGGDDVLNVVFNGTAAQSIGGSATTTFNSITISNTAATVSGNVNFNVGATMTVNASATFSPGVTVVINNAAAAGTITGSGTIQVTRTAATADYSNQYKFSTNTLSTMTVDYAGAGNQSINAFTYGSINTSGSGTRTLTAATTANDAVTIGSSTTLDVAGITLSLSSATITVNGTLDFTDANGSVTNLAGGTSVLTMGSNGLIRTLDLNGLGPAASASLINNGTAFTTTSIDTNGTVEYNRNLTSGQVVTDRNYNNLTLSGAQVKTWTLTATRTVNGNITINASAPLTLSGAQTISVKGNWTNNSSATFTPGASTINFNGTSAQTIGGTQPVVSFNNLTQSNSAGVTLGVGVTVNGVLDLASGDITTGTNTLLQGGTSSASGGFDVVGNVNRTDVTSGSTRSFGNVNVQIRPTANTGSSVTVNLVKGASSLTGSVLREYGITLNGGTSLTATLRLRYLDSELNGNAENSGPVCSLQLWKKTGTTWSSQGSSACDSTANWAETVTSGFSQWTLKGAGAPTACKLEAFQAARSDDGVVLEWRTGHEVNNIGFNVYRQGSDGEMVKLTRHMVAGSGLMVRKNTELRSGLSYYWSDPDTKKSDHPRYWLEDLDADGHTSWNGPFFINEALVPTRPTPPGNGAPGEKDGRGDVNSMTINSLNEANEQSGAYQPSGPVHSTAKIGKMKLAAAVQQADLAGKPAVKISIKQEGWYRISQAQLVAAGISTSTDVKKLQLFVDSQEIPIIVGGGNSRGFDPSGYVEFYGQGLDTPSTDTRVYWLIVGQPGLRIKSFTGLGAGSAGDSFPYTVQRKDRLFYRSEIQNGDAENFFGAFIFSQATDQAMTVTRIAPSDNTTLEIALQGFNAGPHQVQVSLNEAIVGTLNFNDRTRQVFTLTAPQALLTEGANKVTLQALAGSSDFSFVDYIKLTYAHKWEAENNALKFTAPGSSVVTLNGFTGGNIRVVDVTDPKAVQELLAKPSQDNTPPTSITVVTPGGGTRTLLAFVDSKQAAKVAANKPSSLRLPSNQADLVIIGAGDFSSSLQSLQALRQGQGIQTMLVDVEDVYDEFSFGQKSPNALKDFLSYARTNWKKAPKYVLLGGMASFDPRNYMGLGNTDFVPTKIVMTEHLETASDDWFVDFNNDGMPELALGRLPARNADEAARMVQKILNYDQAASGAGVLLVADVNKGFDFEHNNDLLKSIVPDTTAVQDIRRASDPQAHQNLMIALNQGKKLVNYTGHGSIDIWEASLLTSTDAAGLANAQKLSLVVAMTCLNGYFFDERFESLAHALVNAQNGGAVAVWSSTGLTEPDPQSLADQELFRQLFAGASVRLGDAALKAKSVITDSDVRRTWVLIGDPTMLFKQ